MQPSCQREVFFNLLNLKVFLKLWLDDAQKDEGRPPDFGVNAPQVLPEEKRA